MTIHTTDLLDGDEPHPVRVARADGRSALVLACDHYGRRVPRRLGSLGLPEPEFDRHIAWDIGIAGVATRLADALDATLVAQLYSRLVIDCNRPPRVENSIPIVSESTEIPGNVGLGEGERQARIAAVFSPYHAALTEMLDRRDREGRTTILIALHSFTPVYKGEARPWHIGTLYGRDGRLAGTLGAALREEPGLVVGDNQPYDVTPDTDYTIPVHGEARGLLHVGIEIRQDLIAQESGQAAWAARLAQALPRAVDALGESRG